MSRIFETILVPRKGSAYRDSQIVAHSHYREPIDQQKLPHGNSRVWGDIDPDSQDQVVRKIVDTAHRMDLESHDIAVIVAIARVESGFNPDAAAGTTSASGLGQFIDKTGAAYGLDASNRFDVETGATALIKHTLANKQLAISNGKTDVDLWIYKYHHDGPKGDYGGLDLSREHVVPWIAKIEPLVNQYLGGGSSRGFCMPIALDASAPGSPSAASTPDDDSSSSSSSPADPLAPTPELINRYYLHNEHDFPGGCFPVGANTVWHGGVHLLGADGQDVHAMADGTVVCVRMPANDPREDKLDHGSRNFVLVKHDAGGTPWYSLYYHLKSIAMDSDEAARIAWLSGPVLTFTATRNFRDAPSTDGAVLGQFNAGDTAHITGTSDAPWYEVVRPSDGRSGFVKFDVAQMEEGAGLDQSLAEKFSRGDHVYQIGRPVKCGDIIGYVGSGVTNDGTEIVRKPLLHWEVFSPELDKNAWATAEDPDEDFHCDNKAIVDLIDRSHPSGDGVFNADGALTGQEINAFFNDEQQARKLRPYACKFRSEWSIDWKQGVDKLWDSGIWADPDVLTLYNFWDEAAEEDKDLPANGHVWHFNPIAYIERRLFKTARATFFEECFEPDRTFLLPAKAKGLLKKIGKYLADTPGDKTLIVGRAGVTGDTRDPGELSALRADSLGILLTLDKDSIKARLDAKEWDDRERAILLSYLRDNDGKPYVAGEVDDQGGAGLTAAVKHFQTDNNLAVDGNAGKNTLCKAFELLLAEAGIPRTDHVESVGAGNRLDDSQEAGASQDAGAAPEPRRVVEVLLWSSEIQPPAQEFDNDARRTYDAWANAVSVEIGAGGQAAGQVVIDYQIDAGADTAKDDTVTLEARDGSWSQSIAVKDLTEVKPGWVELAFNGLPRADAFVLKQDCGDGEAPVIVWDDVSLEELTGTEEKA